MLSAWWRSVPACAAGSNPLNPLHGADKNTISGVSWPAAAWTSAGLASIQPSGGCRPCQALEVGSACGIDVHPAQALHLTLQARDFGASVLKAGGT